VPFQTQGQQLPYHPDDQILIAYSRGQAMKNLSDRPGGMAAVGLGSEKARRFLTAISPLEWPTTASGVIPQVRRRLTRAI
jgi:acyl transferase domain-containing protein